MAEKIEITRDEFISKALDGVLEIMNKSNDSNTRQFSFILPLLGTVVVSEIEKALFGEKE